MLKDTYDLGMYIWESWS